MEVEELSNLQKTIAMEWLTSLAAIEKRESIKLARQTSISNAVSILHRNVMEALTPEFFENIKENYDRICSEAFAKFLK